MLILKKKFLAEIIAHAKIELPNEACGIVAGPPTPVNASDGDRLRRVNRIYQMANADKSASTFFMDPKEQLKVMKEIRSLGLEMLGIYHSHVASQAYPSARDVKMAFYPEVSYLIISLKDKDNPQIRSFRIVEGKITEERLILT